MTLNRPAGFFYISNMHITPEKKENIDTGIC